MTGILGKYLAGKEAGEQRKDRLPAQLERLQQMNVARQEREQAKALQRAGDILQHTESWLHDPDARLKATDVEVNTYLKLNNEQRTLFGLPPMETAPDPVGDLMQKDILNIQQGGFKVRKMMGADYTPDARIQAIGGASNFMLTKYGDYWVKFLRNTYNQHVLAQGAAQQAAPTQAGADAKQPFAAPPAEPMVPFDPDEIGRKIFEDSFPNPVTETALSPELARIATQLTPEDATALGGLTGHPQLGSLGGSAARAAAVAPPKPMSDNDRLMRVATIMRDVRDLYASGARDFDTLPLRQEAWNLMRPGQPIPAGWGRTGTMTAAQTGNLGLRGQEFDWRKNQGAPGMVFEKAKAGASGRAAGAPAKARSSRPTAEQVAELTQIPVRQVTDKGIQASVRGLMGTGAYSKEALLLWLDGLRAEGVPTARINAGKKMLGWIPGKTTGEVSPAQQAIVDALNRAAGQ